MRGAPKRSRDRNPRTRPESPTTACPAHLGGGLEPPTGHSGGRPRRRASSRTCGYRPWNTRGSTWSLLLRSSELCNLRRTVNVDVVSVNFRKRKSLLPLLSFGTLGNFIGAGSLACQNVTQANKGPYSCTIFYGPPKGGYLKIQESAEMKWAFQLFYGHHSCMTLH